MNNNKFGVFGVNTSFGNKSNLLFSMKCPLWIQPKKVIIKKVVTEKEKPKVVSKKDSTKKETKE